MNRQTKSNIIASTILALLPFGLFGFQMPAGELTAGVAITAALVGLGVMDLKQGAYSSFKRGPWTRA
ncbi:MAG TPA: hypothetical protein DCS60_06770 [Opitutae bacterium]|nr:hypothetical protein [Opitutae bacterium]|tara:strand:- start:8902 stop:9102 length:201 start_codon:yes stop_codon:yes gene_type:complete